MPRHALGRVLAAAATVGALLVGLVGCASADPAPSSSDTPSGDAPAVAQAWWAAWNGADPAALGALFAEDGTYRDLAVNKTSQGRTGVTEWKRRTNTGIDQVQVTAESAFRDGDQVAIQSTYSGHVRGAPAPFRVHMVTILRMRGDLIADNVDYYNIADVLRQSGLPPTFSRP